MSAGRRRKGSRSLKVHSNSTDTLIPPLPYRTAPPPNPRRPSHNRMRTAMSLRLRTGALSQFIALLIVVLGIASTAPRVTSAQDGPTPTPDQEVSGYLTGGWGGVRPSLLNQGVAFEAAYTVDAFANTRGGAQRGGAYLHNVDLTLSVDAAALMGWQGATFFGYVLGNYGDALSEYVGDMQGVSNIEAPGDWKLYEAWFEQAVAGGAASLRVGLYDLNSEFAAVETAGLYLGSSHGIGPDFSQSGLNGPSIFPTTGFATRLLIQPTSSIYFQTALVEAVPGDRLAGTPRVQFAPEEGWLWANEVGLMGASGSKLGVGHWRYTSTFETLAGDGRASGYGLYAIGEHALYDTEQEGARGLALYGRAGWASEEVHPIAFAWAAGLCWNAPFRSRPDDMVGLAVASATQSQPMLQLLEAGGEPGENGETAFEFTYSTTILPFVTIQPNIQFIHNPGASAIYKDALVAGVRLGILF